MKNVDLSIVIPCYNSEENIQTVINDIDRVFQSTNTDYEIIAVNDVSKDNTFELLQKIAAHRGDITVINLAKNCGQHAALLAGFHYAHGNYIATCEDDGQTEISVLPQMLQMLQEGYDIVAPKYTQREGRNGMMLRKIGTWMAIKMEEVMIEIPENVALPIFFVAQRYIIEEVIKYDQPYPYITGLLLRTTHNVGNIDAVQKERLAGNSGYTLKKLFNLWLNGFTSFSILPLRITSVLGIAIFIFGTLLALILCLRKIIWGGVVPGYTSIIAVLLLLGGINLLMLGIIGEYIGRIFMSINHTPQYVVKNVISPEEKEP